MQTELLPCPFCGNAKPNIAIGETVDIICWNCGCDHPLHENEEYAIEAWNSRTPAYDETLWKLVPITPTEEMLNSARDWSLKVNGQGVGNDQATGCYKAMLQAAPKHMSKGSEPCETVTFSLNAKGAPVSIYHKDKLVFSGKTE